MLEQKAVSIVNLSFLPRSPVSNALPDGSQYTRDHHEEEEVLKDDGQALEVSAIDVDAGKAADGPAGANEEQPVPLPATADSAEALLAGQVQATMLAQVRHRDDDRGGKEAGESDAGGPARVDAEVRIVTGRAVDEGPIGEHDGSIALEHEEASGHIGQGVVGPERVVEMLQGRQIEVLVVDDGVCGVVPGGERDNTTNLELAHHDG